MAPRFCASSRAAATRSCWAKTLATHCCAGAPPGFSKRCMARRQRWHSSRKKQLSVASRQLSVRTRAWCHPERRRRWFCDTGVEGPLLWQTIPVQTCPAASCPWRDAAFWSRARRSRRALFLRRCANWAAGSSRFPSSSFVNRVPTSRWIQHCETLPLTVEVDSFGLRLAVGLEGDVLGGEHFAVILDGEAGFGAAEAVALQGEMGRGP